MLNTFENTEKNAEQSVQTLKTLIASQDQNRRSGFRRINSDLLDDLMSRDGFAPLASKSNTLRRAA